MGKSKKLFALIAVLVVLAMVVTGCGSEDADSGDSGSSSDLVEVKIGVSSPFTGDVAALGLGIKNGALLAISDSADELADLGIDLSAFAVDDAADPKTGVNAANQMISDSDLVGVVAHLNSGVSIPTSAVYNEAGVVQVSPASTNPQLTEQGFDNVFRVCTIDTVQGSYAGTFAYNELGAMTAVVLDDSTPYGEGLAAEFAKQFEAEGGEILLAEKIQLKDQDFKALVTKMEALNPDMIYFGGMYTEAGLVSRQAKEAGMSAPVMGGDGLYTQQFIEIGGDEGDFSTSVGLPLSEQPKGQDFIASFEDAYPGETIEAYDTYAYDAAMVIIEAIKTVVADMGADEVTSAEGKRAIIEAVAATDYPGVTGNVSFDEKGDTLNKAITPYVVEGGAWVPAE